MGDIINQPVFGNKWLISSSYNQLVIYSMVEIIKGQYNLAYHNKCYNKYSLFYFCNLVLANEMMKSGCNLH